MARPTRSISWFAAARKEFEKFPQGAQDLCLDALTVAAEGGEATIAKPYRGLGAGIIEIDLPYRGNAFRVLHVLQIAEAIWVIHAFEKKATQGINTPKHEVDLIRDRLKRLKEQLK